MRKNWIMVIKLKQLVFAITYISLFYSCQSIDPDPPSLSEKEIPLVQQPPSKINIPLTVDMKKYFTQVETSVSNIHSDSIQECEGLQYAYMLKRSPFTINGANNTIKLSFQGDYWIKLSYCAKCNGDNCKGPRIGTSCGIDEPLRKIAIAYSSDFKIEKNYKIHSSTSLVTLKPLNKCKVTKLDIDATDKLVEYVKGPLTEIGKKIDKRTKQIDFKDRVQTLWNTVSKEIQLGHLGYLSINPQELSVNTFNIEGSALHTSIGITAHPLITTESKPLPVSPLPNLSEYSPGNGFEIYFDISASYDSLSVHMNRRLMGRSIKIKEEELIITNSKVYGIGNQKVVIALDFKGSRKGKIYFTGTPYYNFETNELSFPDLAFDSKTKDVLIEIKEWIFNDELTKQVRERAKFNFSNLVNEGKEKFKEGINRNLGHNVHLSGTVTSVTINAVYPAKSKLLLRAKAYGTMEIKIRK